MKNCPYCRHPNVVDAGYCSQCGAQLFTGHKQLMLDRLMLLGGELRLVTTMFVSFSGIEKFTGTPEYRRVMLSLHQVLTETAGIVHQFDGTPNIIIPDLRVLGIFGAPHAYPDDVLRTLKCAVEIRDRWRARRTTIKEFEDIDMVIGVNVGESFFGYVLAQFLTVFGDTINAAARLTEICPPGKILISDAIVKKVSESVVTEDFGERIVKGRRESIKCYLLEGFRQDKMTQRVIQLPVFGRRAELDRLVNHARSLASGRLVVCSVNGQMGIGKSRLKDEFKKKIMADSEFNCIETQCASEIQTVYSPFKFMIKSYIGISDMDSEEAVNARISRVGNFLGLTYADARGLKRLLSAGPARTAAEDLRAENEEMYAAVRNLLRQESKKRPVIVIFEEFNRSDGMTRELVQYLIQELAEAPVMLVLINPARDFFTRIAQRCEEINLLPLSHDDVRSLISFILGEVDDKLVDFMYRAAGGNPLFTIEAIRNTSRTNVIKEAAGRWILEKEQHLSFLNDLYSIVMSLLDALAPEDRLIVEYASVIGYSFNQRILEEILGNKEVGDRLMYMAGDGYFVISKAEVDPVVVFRHNLVKDAAYSVLPLKKRREIHQKVGSLTESIYQNQLHNFYEDIGRHYFASGNWPKAAWYNKLSGDKAKNLFAVDQAFSFYNTSLKINKDSPDALAPDAIDDIYLNLTELHEMAGNIQKMGSTAEEGLVQTRHANQAKRELHFVEKLGLAKILAGEQDEAIKILLAGLERAGAEVSDRSTIINAHLGYAYTRKFEYEKSMMYYNISWHAARRTGVPSDEFFCLLNLAGLHKNLGNLEQALEYLNYGLETFSDVRETRRIIQLRFMVAEILKVIGNSEKAKEIFLEVFDSSSLISIFDLFVRAAAYLAVLESAGGDAAAAMRYLDAIDKKRGIFARENLLAEINLHKAVVYSNLNDVERSRDFVINAQKGAASQKMTDSEFECLLLLAKLDAERREDMIREALTMAETMKLPPLIARAMYELSMALRSTGDSDNSKYYGSRALVILNDIKSKLKPENQTFFGRRAEYAGLLEL